MSTLTKTPKAPPQPNAKSNRTAIAVVSQSKLTIAAVLSSKEMGPKKKMRFREAKKIGVGHEKSIRQYLARSATVSKGFGYGHGNVYDTEDSAKAAAVAWLAEIAK